MTSEEKQRYLAAIQTTGYPFEHTIALALEADNWSILQNRYYLDDVTEAPREIDILAYKFHKLHDITIYTALIISCKKSKDNNWVFLTRPLKRNDPNVEYTPITAYANNKIFKHLNFKNHIKTALAHDSDFEPWLRDVFEANSQIFGFQEVGKRNITVQNDKPIYDSISTLVKALNYEIESIPKRTQAEVIYNFHLISVFDTDGVEMKFGLGEPEISELRKINYLSRFLVNKTQAHHLIRFMNRQTFPEALADYNKLHAWYYDKYSAILSQFHENLHGDSTLRNLYREELKARIKPAIDWSSPHGEDGPVLSHDFDFKFLYIDSKEDQEGFFATIGTDDDNIIKFLNDDEVTREALQKGFSELYRLHAKIEYETNNYDF